MITAALILVIAILVVVNVLERRKFDKREERLLNRIMAKDLMEYKSATIDLEKTHAELIEEIEKENELATSITKPVGLRVA